jgi:preprotein translocase subunit SecD
MRLLTVAAGFALALPTFAQDAPKTRVELRRAETAPADGLVEAVVAGTTQKVYLHKAAALTGADIASAKATGGATDPAVDLTFTEAGAKKMAKLSEEHADKPVALVVDGKVLAAPVIRAKLGATVRVTGRFTAEEAAKLVKAIESR